MRADTVQILSGIRDACHVVRLLGVGCSSALISLQCVGTFAWITTEAIWETGVTAACGTLKVHISQNVFVIFFPCALSRVWLQLTGLDICPLRALAINKVYTVLSLLLSNP